LWVGGNHDYICPAKAFQTIGCDVTLVSPGGETIDGVTFAGFGNITYIIGEWNRETDHAKLKELVDRPHSPTRWKDGRADGSEVLQLRPESALDAVLAASQSQFLRPFPAWAAAKKPVRSVRIWTRTFSVNFLESLSALQSVPSFKLRSGFADGGKVRLSD